MTVSAQRSGVVLSEGFESASMKEMLLNWDDSYNVEGMSISTDVPAGSKGKQSLMMTYTPNADIGGFLYKMFPRGSIHCTPVSM